MFARIVRFIIALIILSPAYADTGTHPVAGHTATVPVATKIAPGRKVAFQALGVEIQLNRIIRPGTDDAAVRTLTEYNWTLTNTDPESEILFSNAVAIINGEFRRMANPGQDLDGGGSQAGTTAAVSAGSGLLGFLAPTLGAIGAVAAGAASDAAVAHFIVDNPAAAAKELQKRQFQAASEKGVSLLPTESATGSVWMRQAAGESAQQFQFFVQRGGASRVIKLDLEE